MPVYGKRTQVPVRSPLPHHVKATSARATAPGLSPLQRDVLALQRAAGNQAVGGLIQAKLVVGAAGDQYEQEADRVAGRVMSMPAPVVASQQVGGVQRQEEEELQTKPQNETANQVIANIQKR